MLDRREIMRGAWNTARFDAAKRGTAVRAELREALKRAWAVARNLAARPEAPAVGELTSMGYEVTLSWIPTALVSEIVAAFPAAVTNVSPRAVTLKGRAVQHAVAPLVRRVQQMARDAIAAGEAPEPAPYVSKAEARRRAEKAERVAKAARAAARAAAPTWVERIVVGSYETAEATMQAGDRTLNLTGYGKVWSHYDPEDCSAYGVHPSYDRVRYAYYA